MKTKVKKGPNRQYPTHAVFQAAMVAIYYGFCDGRWDRTERMLRAQHVLLQGGALSTCGIWVRDRFPVLAGVLQKDHDRYFRILREHSLASAPLSMDGLAWKAQLAKCPMSDRELEEEAAGRSALVSNGPCGAERGPEPELEDPDWGQFVVRDELELARPLIGSMGWIDECLAWGVCDGENVDAVLAVLAGESLRSVGLRFGLNHLWAARKAERVRQLRRGLSAELPDLFTI